MVRCIACGKLNKPKKRICEYCEMPLKRHYKKDYTESDWALMWKVAGEQGDKKEQEKIIKKIKQMRRH